MSSCLTGASSLPASGPDVVVRLRRGAGPGKVLAPGESTPSLDAIRASLPELGTLERCFQASRLVHECPRKQNWDPELYDLMSIREEAYRALYGTFWYKEAAKSGW